MIVIWRFTSCIFLRSEYLIFKDILKLNYIFPPDFFEDAKDFVDKLLVGDIPSFLMLNS